MRNALIASSLLFAMTVAPVHATVLSFSGMTQNTNPPPSLGGPCAPQLTVSIGPANATGTSNFGDFGFTASHCIPHPPPAAYSGGKFDFTFTDGIYIGAQLLGTYTGNLTATADPTVFDNAQSYVVTGGTGFFAGASGDFLGTGTVIRVPGQLPRAMQTFTGNVDVVPEPATSTMVLGAMGISGATAARRRRKARKAT